MPGQLAALCERLQFTDHGIDAAPAAELPGRWLSVLTSERRASGSRGCAAIAVTLPELDGSTITMLGLHDNGEQTVLHVRATALGPDASFMPQLWLLDDGATGMSLTPTAGAGPAAILLRTCRSRRR